MGGLILGRIPIAREGFPFILAAFILTVLVWLTGIAVLKGIFAALTVFVIAFFRDPERAAPDDPKAIISPADGKVIKIEKVFEGRLLNAEAQKISIFMNVFNVHVNRAPSDGKVVKVLYNPGKFLSANLDKASLENEQNGIVCEDKWGNRFAFNQIAGLVARRIVCRAKVGDTLSKGERFGLIRFGSRVDVYLPLECKIAVKIGDKVSSGTTILGWWK